MTPQQALALALHRVECEAYPETTTEEESEFAAALLAALPEGWVLANTYSLDDPLFMEGVRHGKELRLISRD